MRILLVEDDPLIGGGLEEALDDQGYVVDWVKDGEAAWSQIRILPYDLAILDVMLPKINGISLCQKMRDAGHTFPVLMLTARDTNTDKVIGLDAGADDYMVKPFDLLELLARLRALLRRSSGQVSRVLSWERLRLDPSTYEVSYAERSLHLTRKEFCLLELLLRNGRRILTRSAMIDGCWSMAAPPEEETVKAHLKTLRQKLRQVGAPDPFIETVRGVGYRLNDV